MSEDGSEVYDYVNPSSIMLRENGAGSNQHYGLLISHPVHPGALRAPMPQHYALRGQQVVMRVPRPVHLSPPSESVPGIVFSVDGHPGVLAKDVLKNRVTLDSAGDPVLVKYGFRAINISIEWPGYGPKRSGDPMHARIDVCPDGQPITRQNLAREICGLLLDFQKNVSRYPVAPGLEKWSLTAGSGGIRVPDIVLFSLHYYRRVWVPELYVIE